MMCKNMSKISKTFFWERKKDVENDTSRGFLVRMYVLAGPKFEMGVHQIRLLTRVEHEIVSKQDFGLPFFDFVVCKNF